MNRQWPIAAAACGLVLGGMIVSHAVYARNPPPPAPIYNPYPPGILPDDLVSEIDRVLREVDVIFKQSACKGGAPCRRHDS